jgi:hypothetical protein
MRILNIFRKNRNKQKAVNTPVKSTNELVKPHHYYTLFDKNWAIEESMIFQTQAVAEDMKVYGWTVEIRWKDNYGEFYPWQTYWNRKIYYSSNSAIEAALKIYVSRHNGYEWRIKPIYVMEQQEYREFKIDKLLGDDEVKKDPEKYDIKGWKIKEDCEVIYANGYNAKYKKGTLFIQLESGDIIQIKNSKDKLIRNVKYDLFNTLIPNNFVYEIKIEDEKWSHPHLLKEVKNKLKLK